MVNVLLSSDICFSNCGGNCYNVKLEGIFWIVEVVFILEKKWELN